MSAEHPRALLARWGLRPKKRYGQNFLMDSAAARRIARLSVRSAGDRVVEIGAGTGALTYALLAEGAAVTAIEIDPQLAALLRSREDLRGAEVVEADALGFDFAAWARGAPWQAAGNLPYNVATPLVLRFCEMRDGPQTVTAMVQKDVADRLAARPGTAAYGSLSVAVAYAMEVHREFTLGPQSFYPQPKIRSTVVRMVRHDRPPVRPHDLELFWKVVRGAFAYRRKTLANSLVLALGLNRAGIERALADCKLSPEIRGERLDLDDFARLADALAEG
ncbi:MAG: 16S rRNA (adenine(1518)-N(6)/adenine(1519)-N(6))-dimethyltransferase RsmA [Candidatus Eremiobacteraeota bacterium]|nr:16S rRNA (adenine(1518)-N(6)/adenine(1519)-N(6))-dimethyltransferase RsmA [Candidatus Eremiobacteraeota bacterium]